MPGRCKRHRRTKAGATYRVVVRRARRRAQHSRRPFDRLSDRRSHSAGRSRRASSRALPGWCPVSYNGASGWVNGHLSCGRAGCCRDPDYVGRRAPARSRLCRSGHRRGAQARPAPLLLAGHRRGGGREPQGARRPHRRQHRSCTRSSRDAGCIKLAGGCQKPWCQVKFPGLSGDRVGWVDSKHLAPANGTCR